jgi:hypothetical protein
MNSLAKKMQETDHVFASYEEAREKIASSIFDKVFRILEKEKMLDTKNLMQ